MSNSDKIWQKSVQPAYVLFVIIYIMETQTTQKELTSTTSLEWDARQRKIEVLAFSVATGLGTALILGLGTFPGN